MSLLSQILSNKKLHGIISFVLHSVNSTEHMLYSFIDYLYHTGGYYRQEPQLTSPPLSPRLNNLKTTGLKLLKRLSHLRQSVKKQRQQESVFPHQPGSNNFDDSDKIFFRGFSATNCSAHHYERVQPQPTAPPRRKRNRVTRSFSLSYGDIISNKQISELYPAFPRSTPIYAVVDKTKKKSRLKVQEVGSNRSEPNLPDLVTLTEVRRDSVKSLHSQSTLEDIKEVSLAAHDADDITEETNETDNETVYLTDDVDDDTTVTTATEEDTNMVKSESANNSPSLISDPYVAAQLYKSKHQKKKKNKKKKDDIVHETHSRELSINDAGVNQSRQRTGN